jgi:hypothetical protein
MDKLGIMKKEWAIKYYAWELLVLMLLNINKTIVFGGFIQFIHSSHV